MALPTGDLLRIQVGGAVPSDTWSISMWFLMTGLGTTPTPSQMNTAASGMLGGLNTVWWNVAGNPWKGFCSTGTTLANSKSYLYRGGLLVASGAATITPVAGGSGTALPNYVARCVTTLTAQPGRSRRGRMYLPCTGGTITAATGLFASVSASLTNLASQFNHSSGAQSTGFFFGGSELATYSVVSSTHGFTTPITSLRCDNIPDTQHGRENKLLATVTDSATIP
jgi:hypothetical protein